MGPLGYIFSNVICHGVVEESIGKFLISKLFPVSGGEDDEGNRTDGGDLSAVIKLVQEGAFPYITGESWSGYTVIHEAASRGYLDILRVLFNNFPEEINIKTRLGSTPLSAAYMTERTNVVEYLIEKVIRIFKRFKTSIKT